MRVSLTGVDDDVDVRMLQALSMLHPDAEWAVLYMPEKGISRPLYPSFGWRSQFLAAGLPHTAVHLCGVAVFHQILDGLVLPEFRRYGRVQVNINAKRRYFTDDQVFQVYATLRAAGLRLILQYHPDTALVIDRFLDSVVGDGGPAVDVLYDASLGRGMAPSAWPAPHRPAVYFGFAGGLGPHNVGQALADIQVARRTAGFDVPYWIDMQSGLRDAGRFSIGYATQVLRQAAAFAEGRGNG